MFVKKLCRHCGVLSTTAFHLALFRENPVLYLCTVVFSVACLALAGPRRLTIMIGGRCAAAVSFLLILFSCSFGRRKKACKAAVAGVLLSSSCCCVAELILLLCFCSCLLDFIVVSLLFFASALSSFCSQTGFLSWTAEAKVTLQMNLVSCGLLIVR
ncbi:uncharacterized protein [Coffea arabica]|uniref:Uncharacterized protein n=1 Tax=Coffea arabica TaxID=13443 RepID=A0ABM4UG76_COFAR